MTKLHDKQIYYKASIPNMGTISKPRFKECLRCESFQQPTTKRHTHWNTHCLNCGERF